MHKNKTNIKTTSLYNRILIIKDLVINKIKFLYYIHAIIIDLEMLINKKYFHDN